LEQAATLEATQYNRTKKAYATTRKLKSAVWTVSKHKDYEKPGKLVQYYASTQRKLYDKGYPNPLIALAAAPRHTLSKLFQLCTEHCALGLYFKKSFISERSHYCEFVNWKEFKLHYKRLCTTSYRAQLLEKSFSELDLQVLLDIKTVLGAVVKFLGLLPHLL
jgi:hypothetical protein